MKTIHDAEWAALTTAQQDKIWEERLERQAAKFADLMEFDAEDEDEEEDDQ
jgi:predicted Fe-S protein YdhL (DUF1289 family)